MFFKKRDTREAKLRTAARESGIDIVRSYSSGDILSGRNFTIINETGTLFRGDTSHPATRDELVLMMGGDIKEIVCLYNGPLFGEDTAIYAPCAHCLKPADAGEDWDKSDHMNFPASKFLWTSGLLSPSKSVYGPVVILRGAAIYDEDKGREGSALMMPTMPIIQQYFADKLEENQKLLTGIVEMIHKREIPEFNTHEFTHKGLAYAIRYISLTLGVNSKLHDEWQKQVLADDAFGSIYGMLYRYQEMVFDGELENNQMFGKAPTVRNEPPADLVAAAVTVLENAALSAPTDGTQEELSASLQAALNDLSDAVAPYAQLTNDGSDEPDDGGPDEQGGNGTKKPALH